MPKRGQRGQQAHQTEQYRKMLNGVPNLCKSQVYNEVYSKLRKDWRLPRFIAVVQYCSSKGLTVEETVETILKSFPSYLDADNFTVDCFVDMVKSYSDIAIAWGYGPLGDEISQIIVKNKALQIVEKTDKMEDIQIYQSLYGKSEATSTDSVDSKTVINFNLTKRD